MPQGKKQSPPKTKSSPTRRYQRLLESIRRIHGECHYNGDIQDLFTALVDELLQLTDSPYGGGGEILSEGDNESSFKIRSVIYPQDAKPEQLDSLLLQVITERKPVVIDRPRNGPFPVTLLGMPIYCDEELIGAVAVANLATGYDKKTAQFLTPLLDSFGALWHAHRSEQQLRSAAYQLHREIGERRRIEAALQEITEVEIAGSGREYFPALVRQLSKTLEVDAAFISVPVADAPGMAEFLALFNKGEMHSGLRYELNGTPCEKIMTQGIQFCTSGLQEDFGDIKVVKDSGWISYFGVPLQDASGTIFGLVAIADYKPIPNRQPAEAVLKICAARISAELMRQRSEDKMIKLSQAIEQTADAVAITDNNGIIEYINPAFSTITGFSADEVLGKKPNILKSGRHDSKFYRQLWDTLQKGQVFSDVFINRKKNGELYYEEKTITPLVDARDNVTHYVSTGKDITERMHDQERLHYLAYHDVLTELPNRSLFMEWLNHAMAVKRKRSRLGVICLDVDRFKIINDTLGHDIGDRMLLEVAKLLKACVNQGDTVARLGSDEFAILVEHVSSPADVINRISKILESASQPLHIDDHELYLTISIGVALAPEDGADASTLLKHADAALNRAKEQGRNTYQFYSADLSDRAFKQLNLETNLYRALERKEFHLCYQPQVNLASGRVTGLEALLRWQHPELGTISPLEFIPLLEDTGLIISVGEWVLRSACEEASRWQQLYDTPLRLSVNLSGRQFTDPDLHNIVAQVLRETRLEPSQLELEITESVIMQDDVASTSNLDALQNYGVRIAIDDFGIGYSSLSYLKRFPVDTLKIDRSFVHDVMHNPDDETIIKAIIAMAESLRVDTIAEGVETLDQVELLRNCGCHTMQGFLLSKPFPANELSKYLQTPLTLS